MGGITVEIPVDLIVFGVVVVPTGEEEGSRVAASPSAKIDTLGVRREG